MNANTETQKTTPDFAKLATVLTPEITALILSDNDWVSDEVKITLPFLGSEPKTAAEAKYIFESLLRCSSLRIFAEERWKVLSLAEVEAASNFAEFRSLCGAIHLCARGRHTERLAKHIFLAPKKAGKSRWLEKSSRFMKGICEGCAELFASEVCKLIKSAGAETDESDYWFVFNSLSGASERGISLTEEMKDALDSSKAKLLEVWETKYAQTQNFSQKMSAYRFLTEIDPENPKAEKLLSEMLVSDFNELRMCSHWIHKLHRPLFNDWFDSLQAAEAANVCSLSELKKYHNDKFGPFGPKTLEAAEKRAVELVLEKINGAKTLDDLAGLKYFSEANDIALSAKAKCMAVDIESGKKAIPLVKLCDALEIAGLMVNQAGDIESLLDLMSFFASTDVKGYSAAIKLAEEKLIALVADFETGLQCYENHSFDALFAKLCELAENFLDALDLYKIAAKGSDEYALLALRACLKFADTKRSIQRMVKSRIEAGGKYDGKLSEAETFEILVALAPFYQTQASPNVAVA